MMTDSEAKLLYNKLAFLSQLVVDLCDKLEATTKPKREFKYHLRRANIEAQKIVKEHYKMWEDAGDMMQPDGVMINGQDIYNINDKAYEYLFNKLPSEVVVIADMVQKMEAKGFDYTEVDVDYKPLLK